MKWCSRRSSKYGVRPYELWKLQGDICFLEIIITIIYIILNYHILIICNVFIIIIIIITYIIFCYYTLAMVSNE